MPETFCLMPDAPTYKKKYICVSYEGEEGVLLRSLVCAALLREKRLYAYWYAFKAAKQCAFLF